MIVICEYNLDWLFVNLANIVLGLVFFVDRGGKDLDRKDSFLGNWRVFGN